MKMLKIEGYHPSTSSTLANVTRARGSWLPHCLDIGVWAKNVN